ncbi:MFS transporter [Cryptosporangium minutisporangium]|uniref:Major facilitator superfamily (MFS) profile domain-containing protein n=1 Tax=Cryptosporangium minutisporangium TaxID=113569 RepID=A0ABP6SU93_9ACTN
MGVADRLDPPTARAEAPPPEVENAGGRTAGRAQGIVLLAASTLPILGALLIAPVLPKIEDAFADVSGVEALAPIALSVPSLAIGLLAPFAGRIIDRVGRIRLLLWALPLYVIAGTAPLYLNSLPAIIGSRALLGVAESAIMTACVTLLGDYYTGKTRDRYLSIQAVAAAFGAVVFLAVGGALGENGWRTPFWVYLVGLVFLPLMAWLLFPPTAPASHHQASGSGVQWSRLTPLLVLTFLGAIVFYALQVQLSVVLDDLGEGSGAIGASAAIANLALALAAVGFGVFNRGRPNAFLLASLLLSGGGLVLLAFGSDWLTVTLGAIVAGVGGGFMLPALLIGVTSRVDYANRGTVTGAWTASFFLGQFVSPIVVNGLDAGTGSLTTALKIVGVFGIALVVPALLIIRRTPLVTNASVLAGPVPAAVVESVELPPHEPEDGVRDATHAPDLTGRIDADTVKAVLAAQAAAKAASPAAATAVAAEAAPAAEAPTATEDDAPGFADAEPEPEDAVTDVVAVDPAPAVVAEADAPGIADAEPEPETNPAPKPEPGPEKITKS